MAVVMSGSFGYCRTVSVSERIDRIFAPGLNGASLRILGVFVHGLRYIPLK